MVNHRLNLNALRANRVLRLVRHDSSPPKTPAPPGDLALTRRGFVGVATLTAIGLTPSLKLMNSLAHGATDSLAWEISQTRVAFRLGGRDRWVIDLNSFSGHPQLTVQKREGYFLIHLAGARFPGTCLPADFFCELRQGTFSWNMILSFTLGGFTTYAPFEKWLMEQESACSAVKFDTSVCSMGLDGQLRLHGNGTASFRPDWRFEWKGNALTTFRGQGGDLTSDVLHLSLLNEQAASLANQPSGTRTLLGLKRGTHPWLFSPAFTTPLQAHLVYHQNAFDTLHLETWEDSKGKFVCGMLAEGTPDTTAAWFHPHAFTPDSTHEPLAVPLARIQYARVWSNGEQTREEAMTARFLTRPTPVSIGGCSLEIGGRPSTPPFELLNQEGKVHTCCEPEVFRIAVPLGGAIVEPIELPRGTTLLWNTRNEAPVTHVQSNPRLKVPTDSNKSFTTPSTQLPKAVLPQMEHIQPAPAQIKPDIVGPIRVFTDFRSLLEIRGPFTVAVLRPEDLLVLKFEFKNLTLQAAAGQPPMLVRSDQRGKPSVIVHVPPQSIGEQAFFEAAQDCRQPSKILLPKTGSPGAKQFAEEKNPVNGEPVRFPIQAGLSGWSRLVFQLPDEVPSLAYSLTDLPTAPETTLPGLLDWNRLTPVVSPAAAPPPPPPRPFLRPHIDLIPKRQIPPALPQGRIPQIVPRSVPEQKNPLPQSMPVDPPPTPPIWHVGYREAHPFLLTRAVFLRDEYRHRTQLKQQLPTQPLRPQIQPKPIQPSQPIQPKEQIVIQPDDIKIALLPPRPPAKEHLPNVTAIEAPYRLFLSPSHMGGWAHAKGPAQLNGRHELWHSRLGVKKQDRQKRWFIDEQDEWYRTMRAIWSPDFDPNREKDYVNGTPTPERWQHFSAANLTLRNPFRMSLDARDRNELVHLMADSTVDAKWPSRVAKVDQFMLTALGAWMHLRYGADVPLGTPLTVEEWRHRGTMGRDHFVRVVYKGYLFPFGHRASLIKVTERKLEQVDGTYVACLRQRMFIVVREPEKSYPGPGQNSAPSHGRSFPYQEVHCRTLVTPNLDDPTTPPSAIDPGKPQEVFWPHVCGNPFQFQLTGIDHAGRETEFSLPCAFVSNSLAYDLNWLKEKILDRDGADLPDRKDGKDGPQPSYLSDASGKTAGPNLAVLGGQKIAYAPMQPAMDTVLETVFLMFGAELPTNTRGLEEAGQPLFYPVVHRTTVRVPAIQQIIGDATPITVRYAQRYKDLEWNPNGNAGTIYLQLIAPLALGFPSDKAGGIATPNMDITAMSARKGPVGGDLNTFAQGTFDPKQFFNKAKDDKDSAGGMKQARFLGGIALGDIIMPGPSSDAPEMITERSGSGGTDGIGTHAAEEVISTKYTYETTKLQKDPLGLFVPNPSPPVENSPSKLTINTRVDLKFAQGQSPEPQFNIDGKVSNFELNLFKMILVRFKSLAFRKEHGKDLDVSPDIDDVKFGGPLAFVQKLADAVGGNSDSGLASLLPTPFGVPRILPARLVLTAGGAGGGGCKGKLDFKFLKSFSPAKVSAGFMLCIPDLTLGALTIDNMSVKVEAELKLLSLVMGTAKDVNWDSFKKEFEKAFTVALAFSTRDSPFHLIVYIFGGGGFLGFKVGASGLLVLEASIEFGAQAKLNLGVASGAIHVFAGIYFKLEQKEIEVCVGNTNVKKTTMSILLEGYVRMGGHVNVLGIITITVEFKLALQYINDGGQSKLAGEASLVVKVEVLFFSASVTLKVRKEFAGSSGSGIQTCELEETGNRYASAGFGIYRTQNRMAAPVLPPPPKIIDLVTKPEWNRYVAAFAAD
jgi:hypothetical protein